MTARPSTSQHIIEAVTAPLGFFVLALLIVEAFLATVLVGANLQEENKITGMWVGVGLFVFVTFVVSVFVWFRPLHLIFDKKAHLIDRGRAPLGSEKKLVTTPAELRPTEATQEKAP